MYRECWLIWLHESMRQSLLLTTVLFYIPALCTSVTILYSPQPLAAAIAFCPPLPPPDVRQRVEHIKSGDVQGLSAKLAKAVPYTTLFLADGLYTLSPDQSLEVLTAHVTLRSASGKREAVIIEGGYNNISVNSDDFTVADVTLQNPIFHNIQVRGEKGIARPKMYNVRMRDAGQQLLKVSAGDGLHGKFADAGLVACSLLEYSTYARGTSISLPNYTNGVDILAGKDWIVRDNVFRRIRSAEGPAGPAILAWKNSLNTMIQRNLIIDCWRGISLGLSTPDKYRRGGSQIPYDHQNGLVESNVILALTAQADAAIENNYALNSRIFHNTVYYSEAIQHAVNWSIEVRFALTTAVIKNNLTNLPIIARQPLPTQPALVLGNVVDARQSWFRNVHERDAHLHAQSPARSKGVFFAGSSVDLDGEKRPERHPPDAGADEFSPQSPPATPGK